VGKIERIINLTKGVEMRNVKLIYSPDEGKWYYQKQDPHDWRVSKKSYDSKEEALRDYYDTDSPEYVWE
jgi:hypothetical protein